MKVIISHDVDHITAWEHKRDLILPKFILRAFIEFGLGYISSNELGRRFLSILSNRWNYIEDLMAFDRQHGVPSTFFVGVSRGQYLAYRKEIAVHWINRIKNLGFDVGVHGIAYNNLSAMVEEHKEFKGVSGLNTFGIRMHYLRSAPDTIENLSKIGYAFDSTEMAIKNPYKIGNMWEFPLHVMDGYIFNYNSARWQNRKLEEAWRGTKECVKTAASAGIKYFTLLFHDRYFSDEYMAQKIWYEWFISYCKKENMPFISFRNAIFELDKERFA